jgi:hypothetical protein
MAQRIRRRSMEHLELFDLDKLTIAPLSPKPQIYVINGIKKIYLDKNIVFQFQFLHHD